MSTPDGYAKLARLMGAEPETALFRRFGSLTMINLLRLQAELQDLEQQLEEAREEDTKISDGIRNKYVHDFRLMRDEAEEGDSIQHDLLLDIGRKLEEYHTALDKALRISSATVPTRREIKFLQTWLKRPSMGNNFLNSPEDAIWSDENVNDLISVRASGSDDDVFTSFLNGSLLSLYHRIWGERHGRNQSGLLGTNIRRYNDSHIFKLSKIISTTLSSLLPTLAILVLFFVKRMLLRIGLVIVFTAIFSFTLSVTTEARKVDIFSATAAFAAVEVVFVGSTAANNTA
ncbi:hypothetical protein BCR34DRAFT_587055 [Clohesyomyces aquaticus]|uniref:DUF6594 domain-containing protein n=1 Tax=Clohesyomyces aquaticus TaxID=1231657 RepID=A0A1Y1ZRB7_9PLEO|nr:hypothetical protein BCR34DRAFT_587055 [Clohesyomyces aquaticus]